MSAGAVASVARAAELTATATAQGLDALLLTSDASIAYASGFPPLQLERIFAVVLRPGGGSFVLPALDGDGARVLPHGLEVVTYEAASDGLPELKGALHGARRIGVEEAHLVLGRARVLEQADFELVAAGGLVMGLRVQKDRDEIERMRRACRLVSDTMERMYAELRVGDVEREVNARVETWLRDAGASEAHAHVLFGDNGANPHGRPGDRRLQPGEVVCADIAARVESYWGDLTRCGSVGPPSAWAEAAWEVVREAQAAALGVARAGVSGSDIDAAQRRIVEGAPNLGRCLHGAGHAIGLEIHEPPFLVPRWTEALVAGTALTIEPGIYQAGEGGIRLEDQVVLTEDGVEFLSDMPLELRAIPE